MKPSSIFVQLIAFTVIVVMAAMALSFAIALAFPPPASGRMNVNEMDWALRRERSSVIDIEVRDAPPVGQRSFLVEAALARALNRASSDIRAVWIDALGSGAGRGQTVVSIDDREVLIDASSSGFQLRYGPEAVLRTDTFVPLFVAAAREPDGRWLWGVPEDPAREAWLRRIVIAFLVGMLALTPLAALLSRRIAKPVERLGKAAGLANAGDRNPFPVEGPCELRATAQAMNTMHARIHDQTGERLRMLAGLAHDLRTPLTALRLRAEGAPDLLRKKMGDDLIRMNDMVAEMLDRATIGAYEPQRTVVDLAGLVRACCNSRIEAGEGVVTRGCGALEIESDPILARRLIENLLDNALRYGTQASVSVSEHDGSAVVTIDDDGPGIPEDRIEEALKPFARLDPDGARHGAGLGLAIASEIANAIGAKLKLTNRTAGLRASVLFPRVVSQTG